MKFITTKNIFLTLALFSLVCGLISSASLKKTDSMSTESLENERRRSKAKRHIFRAQINPPYVNGTNYTLSHVFGNSINISANTVNMKDFKTINLNSKFHEMFDKQIEEIFLIFKKNNVAGITDFRSSYALFIKNFNNCDKDGNLLLNKDEFAACMISDPYLKTVQQPGHSFSVMRNFTNETAYNGDLFEFANNYDLQALNFYDYVMIRLFAFAWRKCTVATKFMDEATFECAIEITSGTKSLNTNTLRNIFQLGLRLTNTKSMPMRTLDFLTYYALASSIKLFGRVNARENFDATIIEFNIALDTNALPTRYNQDTINQMFRIIKKDSISKNGLDLYTFVYYDHFLKLFYQGANGLNRWTLNPPEFKKVCGHWLFPNTIFNYMQMVPTVNFTDSSFNLRAHISDKHLDEEENFAKFLEVKSSSGSKIKSKTKRFNNTSAFNEDVVSERIFNMLDSNNNHLLTFYDFANFIQTFDLYAKVDNRDADRVIVSDIYTAFTDYSDLPTYSSEFRARSKRFSLIEPDLYIDPFYVLAITRMDDYVHHFLRRGDPTTIKEVELHLVLDRINLKNFPAAHLDKCARGKDANGIPKYDWECGITTAINRSLKFFEYSRDLADIKSHGLNLTYSAYDYASEK